MSGPLKVGIAGLGTVGAGVAQLLRENKSALSVRAGREIEVTAVSARESRDRGFDMSGIAFEKDANALAARRDVDCVVELMGGSEGVARSLVRAALENGKHVVTANKALLAHHGAALAGAAEKSGVALKFEAAVCGGIPIVKALRESLVAYEIATVRGILNGTCNFILTQMEATGRSFSDVLSEAQRLGYAEADPTLDIGGGDTAHKLALLSAIAFGTVPDIDAVVTSGIQNIAPDDIVFAGEFGYRLKLLGVARRVGDAIEQRVHPAMVPAGTPLADVDSSFNAVVADAGAAGSYFFEGKGAGRAPTASAVIADIVDVARGDRAPAFGRKAKDLAKPKKAAESARSSAFYLRFQVLDVPGVMAEISGQLAEEQVSIDKMLQRGRAPGEPVSIVMITHDTPQTSVERALKRIGASDKVFAAPGMIPMEAI